MHSRIRSAALGSALAALLLSSVACAHAPARAETQTQDLDWAMVLARYMARSAEPAVLFVDEKQVQAKLDDLQANEKIIFAIVRNPAGQELGRWGTLPTDCELPATGPQELSQAREGQGVVRVPIYSSYSPDEFLGDLILLVRTEPGVGALASAR